MFLFTFFDNRLATELLPRLVHFCGMNYPLTIREASTVETLKADLKPFFL
jgi:hypothetical protein